MPYYHKSLLWQKNGSNFAPDFEIPYSYEYINDYCKNFKRKENNMKLVALGDSIMKGVLLQSVGDSSRYSLADKSILDRCAEMLGAEGVHLGKMGCTIEDMERELALRHK